jgi:hypothetical protein
MLDKLTCADFEPLVGEIFEVRLAGAEPIGLTLASAKAAGMPGGPGLRQPFALVFVGPESRQYLLQGTYRLEHERLPGLELFIVPLGPQAGRMRYEAVFG